jgi:hypothetical protein
MFLLQKQTAHCLAILAASMCFATAIHAQTEFPATLSGHVVIPAQTFVNAPADAPSTLQTSGKYTTGKRVEELNSIEGLSGGRPTGVKLPFKGQPIQGHSGIKKMSDGTYWILTDNGAGSKANSPDFMLYLNHYKIDFATGTANLLKTVFLHDPDKKVPFRIVHEATDKRYLTGADFDPESFQFAGGYLWVGEEFGPYIIKAELDGKIVEIFETLVDGKLIKSPDHFSVVSPNTPTDLVAFQLRRSKGYEGMAASTDGTKLYPLLEGALWDEATKSYETVNDKQYLRIVEFDVKTNKFTGRHWKYVLEANSHAIGDFNMMDASSGLIIERDNGEGTQDKACPADKRRTDCFHDLAKFKRVYKIELNDANVGGPVRKIAFIDLMKIQDPQKNSKKPLNDGVLTFPFFTIENVDIVDARHIIVGNDNNLPFSSSRDPNKADDNELVLLEVEAFLKAK